MESWTYLNRVLLYPFGRISNLEVNKKLHQPVSSINYFFYVTCCWLHRKYFCGFLLYKITKEEKKNLIAPKSCALNISWFIWVIDNSLSDSFLYKAFVIPYSVLHHYCMSFLHLNFIYILIPILTVHWIMCTAQQRVLNFNDAWMWIQFYFYYACSWIFFIKD